MQLIPAMDLRDGRCVRLLRGDFAAETRYAVTPEALYAQYANLGASWMHVVDLDGARDGVLRQLPIIAALAQLGTMRLQVGGGLRDRATVEQTLAAGVERVVIGSLALTDPDGVMELIQRFGVETVVLAFDVRLGADGVPRVATRGWLDQSAVTLWDAVERFAGVELRHVLCTDIDRDGALAGPNGSLYADAVRRFPEIEWQASGGVRDVRDLRTLQAAGAAAAISGRALLEEQLPILELRPFLPAA